ncbi:hypothetical protein MKZ38_002257 [Zalerion maritima]|uniref:KAR9-domain-containing protein n=1 Tax=Zalerion maritima TaxID=339359 RepID=A0AAD5RP77_9PEZI|nr:hypothetical protein MKZ38_002257 [Zalerion maritima]
MASLFKRVSAQSRGDSSTASYEQSNQDGVSAADSGGGNDCGRQQEVQPDNNDRTSHLSDRSQAHFSSSHPINTPNDSSHMHNPNAVGGDSVPITLEFADVDNEIVKLDPFKQNSLQNASLNANNHPHISITPTKPHQQDTTHTPASTIPNASASATTSTSPSKSSSALHPRKPSPGLAARLKALGFGGSRKDSAAIAANNPDNIGRLPEDQLRQLDEKHLAASGTIQVERKGRPWKGPGPLSLLSKSSRDSLRRRTTTSSSDDTKSEPSPNNIDASFADSASAASGTSPVQQPASIDLLPEIDPSPPINMDTNKYRLPDHTNGNGTKVQLSTRQEHIDRDTRPPSPDDTPPPPLPKDSPIPRGPEGPPGPDATPTELTIDPFSFNPLGLQRPGSIYTLSRASFANQLAQLTSLQLPDAESLSGKVSAIPTAEAATKALILAAEQIRSWIHKASEVIGGLDSDDDVEWAAAGGREGLAEVEHAISRFEELIKVYISAIEALQGRADISSVALQDNQRAVSQMEIIVTEWEKIHVTLQSVKMQVEIAMEWEELWDQVLGDIQSEMDELCRLVFEMEERRHRVASGEGVDINDLETIVEENVPSQPVRLQAGSRFSLPTFPLSPSSPHQSFSQDDSSLLALFARMQPLRASLDFLPMRLAGFMSRAETTFPTSCEELEMRKTALEASYKKLEKDAESLRKELGEDRWLLVFRGAGRQAQKMYESVERSVMKLKEAVDAGMHLTNQPAMLKKIESFDAKKTHYSPAIERILAMIEKGVRDRLTVNGEIMRLHLETRTKWEALKEHMREMDSSLEEIQAEQKRGQQLRDSISSMLSNDRSTIGSGNETPGSSPPSSVIMSTLGLDPKTPMVKKSRASSLGSSHLPQPRRNSSVPSPNTPSHLSRKPGSSRLSTLASSTPKRLSIATPAKDTTRPDNRPRWNGSTNTADLGVGHNFRPLTLTSPSPYAKSMSPRSTSSLTPDLRTSKLPTLKSPLSRAGSMSPAPAASPTPARNSSSRLAFRDRVASPGPYAQKPSGASRAALRLQSTNSMSSMPKNNRRASMQPPKLGTSTSQPTRPASSMASSSRRSSMLPQPKGHGGTITGRESPQAMAGARAAMKKSASAMENQALRWRY